MSLPELGVGIIHCAEIEGLLASNPELIDVVELEPQTSWRYSPGQGLSLDRALLDRLQDLPQRKLVHGVGFPVGGSCRPDARQLSLFRETIEALRVPWASEHLGFNRVVANNGGFNTGFLLPPLLQAAGIHSAAASIRAVTAALPVPFAVETGVNYLRPRPGDLDDGAFVAAVVDEAECGILLDLHNLWANERNGRQPVRAFLEQIPLEKVWEIHIAGGLERDGYWLDAHSGAIPEELLELAATIVPQTPSLSAIVFEILPTFLPEIGLAGVREELIKVRRLWERRGTAPDSPVRPDGPRPPATIAASQLVPNITAATESGHAGDASDWESALGSLVIGRPPASSLARELARDPGVGLLQKLVWQFRAGAIADVLGLTCRLLIISLGEEALEQQLDAFFGEAPPQLFGSAEAHAFGEFLLRSGLEAPFLPEIVGFEMGAIRAQTNGEAQLVDFRYEPEPLLLAISAGRLPDAIDEGRYEVEITPDSDVAQATTGRVLTTT